MDEDTRFSTAIRGSESLRGRQRPSRLPARTAPFQGAEARSTLASGTIYKPRCDRCNGLCVACSRGTVRCWQIGLCTWPTPRIERFNSSAAHHFSIEMWLNPAQHLAVTQAALTGIVGSNPTISAILRCCRGTANSSACHVEDSGFDTHQHRHLGNAMSLNKATASGKEHRKPYRGGKRCDSSCRNHGSCSWCERNRTHQRLRDVPADIEEQVQDVNPRLDQ